jgi:serine/threonine protein kinase
MIGQLVGHYKVVRKIGDGGMGSVFEAVHESIGRNAAIKVLHPRFSTNEQVVTRFFNEARAVNIVNHPGIVGCFDFGQLADGTAYIVMEYLDGETLSARINRINGPLGADGLRIGRQIAAALAAAHGKGSIHRDPKPSSRNPRKPFQKLQSQTGAKWTNPVPSRACRLPGRLKVPAQTRSTARRPSARRYAS